MAERVLSDLGSNCSQSSTTISLDKTDLGLTGNVCTLDQIIVAIMVKAGAVMTETFFNSEPNQNCYISPGFNSFTTKNDSPYEVRQLVLNMAKPDTGATIDPNDY